VSIHQAAWNSLPDDIKAAFDYLHREAVLTRVAAATYAEGPALKQLRDEGGIMNVIPDEEVAKMDALAQDVWVEACEGDPDALHVVELLKDYVKYCGR